MCFSKRTKLDYKDPKCLSLRPITLKFHKVSHRLKIRLYHEVHNQGYSVTPDQMMILGKLWEHEGLSQNELCQLTTKGKSNVTRIITNLVNKGLVIRETNPKDRRSFTILLTETGLELRKHITPILHSYLDQAFSDFTEEEFKQFEFLLQKIANNLDKMED